MCLVHAGDDSTSNVNTASSVDESDESAAESGLRSWPPKSHSSGAAVSGINSTLTLTT